jgi:ribokinase
VEWVDGARVEHLPAAGEIVHATESWAEPAGGGAGAAVQLARLAGAATLFTALGDDELGHRSRRELEELGVRVEAVVRPEPQRRALILVDAAGERTITVIGDRMVPRGSDPLPWRELRDYDAVYVTGGDPAAVRAARAARVLTATPRTLATLTEAAVRLDALIGSGRDAGERYDRGQVSPEPGLVVRTDGERGGTYETAAGERGRYEAVPPPGPIRDAYGCGDSFAAGLTYALGAGEALADALGLAARCGAACLTGRGAYEGQLRLGA